jgi:hypothetical protein
MPKPAKRLTILRAGKPKRRIIVSEPPFPKIGESIMDEATGLLWLVVATEDAEVLLSVSPEAPSA